MMIVLKNRTGLPWNSASRACTNTRWFFLFPSIVSRAARARTLPPLAPFGRPAGLPDTPG